MNHVANDKSTCTLDLNTWIVPGRMTPTFLNHPT